MRATLVSLLPQVLAILGTPFLFPILIFLYCLDKPTGEQDHSCNTKNKEMKSCFLFYTEEPTLWYIMTRTVKITHISNNVLLQDSRTVTSGTKSKIPVGNQFSWDGLYLHALVSPEDLERLQTTGTLNQQLVSKFAFCCPQVTLGHRNYLPLQIHQNSLLPVQMEAAVCLVTAKKIGMHASRELLSADSSSLAAKLVAASHSFPYSYIPVQIS